MPSQAANEVRATLTSVAKAAAVSRQTVSNVLNAPHRVRDGVDKGRGFVLYRKPHRSAVDPDTGEEYQDLLVIRTPNADEKEALVAGPGPFFTIDHFSGYNAVLVQLSRLGEIDRDELAEVILDAWRTCAPKSLVKQHPELSAEELGGSA